MEKKLVGIRKKILVKKSKSKSKSGDRIDEEMGQINKN